MKLGAIEITPLASESMGVRSLCTHVKTPDISLLLDPSAALAFRPPYDPHPEEYRALDEALDRIRAFAESSDFISVSHYHYDHVRPGLLNWHYNFSSRDDLLGIFGGKRVLAKDNREKINPSQRRRAFFFEKDLRGLSDIEWADGRTFSLGDTNITFSHPVPHGPEESRLGFVLITIVEHDGRRFVFAPDVQGPICRRTLSYLLGVEADLMVVGGPPIYLKRFSEKEGQVALYSLTTLATSTKHLVVDHHLMRSNEWMDWITPIKNAAERRENDVMTMAELGDSKPQFLEANRETLYKQKPPDDEFLAWLSATDEFKRNNKPPV